MDEIERLAQAVRDTIEGIDSDPSPHAPEIPFYLREDINALLQAIDRHLATDLMK